MRLKENNLPISVELGSSPRPPNITEIPMWQRQYLWKTPSSSWQAFIPHLSMGPELERGSQESPCTAKIMKAAKRYKSVQCRTFPWSHSVLCNLTQRPPPSTPPPHGRRDGPCWDCAVAGVVLCTLDPVRSTGPGPPLLSGPTTPRNIQYLPSAPSDRLLGHRYITTCVLLPAIPTSERQTLVRYRAVPDIS